MRVPEVRCGQQQLAGGESAALIEIGRQAREHGGAGDLGREITDRVAVGRVGGSRHGSEIVRHVGTRSRRSDG
jgi:hypothetical protein